MVVLLLMVMVVVIVVLLEVLVCEFDILDCWWWVDTAELVELAKVQLSCSLSPRDQPHTHCARSMMT